MQFLQDSCDILDYKAESVGCCDIPTFDIMNPIYLQPLAWTCGLVPVLTLPHEPS